MIGYGHDYDFARSTEANYSAPPEHDGKDSKILRCRNSSFDLERSLLDRTYHAEYVQERVDLQDSLIQQVLDPVARGRPLFENPSQSRPWLLLTAGPMGAGKSHVVSWLGEEGYLPLDSFVRADPDCFRERLPEWEKYNSLDPETAGRHTNKAS